MEVSTMAVKIEAYGTRQKKTCFGCGSMISFENGDIKENENGTYVECPVCGKKIKAHMIDREAGIPTRESEVGRKAREAFENTDDADWDETEEEVEE